MQLVNQEQEKDTKDHVSVVHVFVWPRTWSSTKERVAERLASIFSPTQGETYPPPEAPYPCSSLAPQLRGPLSLSSVLLHGKYLPHTGLTGVGFASPLFVSEPGFPISSL